MSEKITDLVTPISINSEEMIYTNKVYLSPQGNIPPHKKYILLKGYVLPFQLHPTIPKGKIGLGKKFRQFLVLSLIDQAVIMAYDPKSKDAAAASLNLQIQLLLPPKQRVQVDDDELVKLIKIQFDHYYVGSQQIFVLNFMKQLILVTVERVIGGQEGSNFIGKQTAISCVANGQQQIRLKSTKNVKKNIFQGNFTMSSLGIGGLDNELTSLFRRAFASRRLPHSIVEKFGIKHVKGILLFGPPGTGKTLIARQLAKSLKAKSLQIVNGPQVFSKFVGESQENIRKLFLPAREDQKKYGQESPLHVIVFDEIDAICRQRGSDNSGTNAKDAVVNQLLTNLDGVEALDNIIVIGMTNRKDLIDEAVLRPGRLEVHIEIGIPSEEGRLQILKIHTQTLKDQNLLNKDVNLEELAQIAKNYTGAELQAVVKNASSFAMTKGNNMMDFSKNLQIKKGTTVTRDDFLKAIQQIPPSFGMDTENFEVFVRNPLINYGPSFGNLCSMLQKITKITLTGTSQVNSVLLHGPPGSGKTSLASHFSKQSKFTYIKLITPQKYIGVSTYGRINSITKIFTDAYKAKESLIVIDNIQRLIQYVQTGPDFNNSIMQALLVLIRRIPVNPDCKLLVLGTTSNLPALDLLDIDKAFGLKLKVPLLNGKECAKVLGADIGIQAAPIKKLINFKQICVDKPKSLWKDMWTKYQA